MDFMLGPAARLLLRLRGLQPAAPRQEESKILVGVPDLPLDGNQGGDSDERFTGVRVFPLLLLCLGCAYSTGT